MLLLEGVEHVEEISLLLQGGALSQLVHQGFAVHVPSIVSGEVHLSMERGDL